MPDIARERTDLDGSDIDYLQALLADWTIIADLAFADLLLWLPTWNEGGFIAAAQLRPTTARTHIPDDLVGHFVPRGRHHELDRAFATHEMCEGAPRPQHTQTLAVPVVREGRVLAVLGCYRNAPTTGRLETAYAMCADDLFTMLASGQFPRQSNHDQGTGGRGGAPRVGDGLVVLDESGAIEFASPNARSAFRRLGVAIDIEGMVLADVVAKLNRTGVPINDTLSLVARGAVQAASEIHSNQSTATIRSIPLVRPGKPKRTLVLLRDVTDIRRRDQALLGKDAAIREIHHRVKNNLQTVASLLRLQGRRLPDEASRNAIAEAGRRVATIAVVHDLLAHNPGTDVDFDDVAARVVTLTVETSGDSLASTDIGGSFGTLPSDRTTTLALVLAELVANAIEHGGAGQPDLRVSVDFQRTPEMMIMVITDNGPGITVPGADGLGLAIVKTLVVEELGGSLDFTHSDSSATHRGTIATVQFPAL